MNSYAPSPTCGHERINTGPCSASARKAPLPSTGFTANADSTTCTRRSSPVPIARAPGRLFRVTTLPRSSAQREKQEASTGNGFFRQRGQPDRVGPAGGRTARLRPGQCVHLWPDLPGGKLQYPRHAAEFWMIEPEMAFADLQDNMDLGEEMIKNITTYVMDHCRGRS